MIIEYWLAVVGFPGYDVSNFGRVRGWKTRWGNSRMPHLLKTHKGKGGYSRVCLVLDGKKYTKMIHGLVLEAFKGPRPLGQWACHGSGGIQDNSISNLSWCMPRKNNGDDKRRDGTMQDQRGEKSPSAKLTEKEVLMILLSDASQRAIAHRYGVSQTLVSAIKTGKVWGHIERRT